MTASWKIGTNSRGVGRPVLLGVLGVGLLLAVGVLVFSGVITDTGTPGSENPDKGTNSSDPVSPDDGAENDTDPGEGTMNETQPGDGGPENGTDTDTPENVSVSFDVWELEVGNTAGYHTQTLRNESGYALEELTVSPGFTRTYENLTAGENYTLVVEIDQWPTKRYEFTAGESRKENVVLGYEFQGAESFGWSLLYDFTETKGPLQVTGEYASNGDADFLLEWLNFEYEEEGPDGLPVGHVRVDGTTYVHSENSDGSSFSGYAYGYPIHDVHDLVFKGLGEYDDRTFLNRLEIEDEYPALWIGDNVAGKTLDMYRVDMSSEYSEGEEGNLYEGVTVYVNPQTGRTVRIETESLGVQPGDGSSEWILDPGIFIMDFYNFGEEYNVSKDDLDLEPP